MKKIKHREHDLETKCDPNLNVDFLSNKNDAEEFARNVKITSEKFKAADKHSKEVSQ